MPLDIIISDQNGKFVSETTETKVNYHALQAFRTHNHTTIYQLPTSVICDHTPMHIILDLIQYDNCNNPTMKVLR